MGQLYPLQKHKKDFAPGSLNNLTGDDSQLISQSLYEHDSRYPVCPFQGSRCCLLKRDASNNQDVTEEQEEGKEGNSGGFRRVL